MRELIEKVARALVWSRGAEVVASDENWPKTVAHHYEMCAKYRDYDRGLSLVTDAFRDARTAIQAMHGESTLCTACSHRILDVTALRSQAVAIEEIKRREYECFIPDHEPKPWTPGQCAGYAGRSLHLMRCKRRDGHGIGGLFCRQHAISQVGG